MAKKSNKSKKSKSPSTQGHMPFSEIRQDTVIMKDGTLRAVLLVSSINFSLKSEDEQQAIIQGYVGFLNTIDFPFQIVIQSRKLNIERYLKKLDNIAKHQDNELLRKQTKSYRSFVSRLVDEADIMDKKFFAVVPYSPLTNKKKSYWTRLQEVVSPASVVKLKAEQFRKYREELMRRTRTVVNGLEAIGLDTQMLDTEALIELYANSYNPSYAQRESHSLDELQVEKTF